jgi:hypothetical protein
MEEEGQELKYMYMYVVKTHALLLPWVEPPE